MIICPECGAKLRPAQPMAAGTIIQCHQCRRRFRVPAEASAEPLDVLPVSEASAGATPHAETGPMVVADVIDALPVQPIDQEPLDVVAAPVPKPQTLPPRLVEPVSSARTAPASGPELRPFELGPDERLLLAGGFGSVFGWVWTLSILPMTLFCFVPISIMWVLRETASQNPFGVLCGGSFLLVLLAMGWWPFLRSGRYWLTTRRLHWKPRLGKPVAFSLQDIDVGRIRAGVITSSLRIRGQPRLSLRYIRGMERLWGGLLLFKQLGAVDLPAEESRIPDTAWWQAFRVRGISSQRGFAILRPNYFAFLPAEGKKSPLLAFAGDMALNVVGAQRFTAEAKLPFDLLIPMLCNRDPGRFDDDIRQAVQRFGGLLWEPGAATVIRESFPLQPSRDVILFRGDGATIRGAPPREQLPVVGRLLSQWNAGMPIARRRPTLRLAAVSAFVSLLAVLPFGCSAHFAEEAKLDLGSVEAADVLDAEKVPEGAFVTISGRPDLSRVSFVSGSRTGTRPDVLLVFNEAPRLVLYCSESQPLSKTIYRADPDGEQDASAAQELQKPWTVSGRVYRGGSAGDAHASIPLVAVNQYAKKELGLASSDEARVLVVGMKPSDLEWSARAATGVGVGLTILAGLLWLVTLWTGVRRED